MTHFQPRSFCAYLVCYWDQTENTARTIKVYASTTRPGKTSTSLGLKSRGTNRKLDIVDLA